MANSMERGSAQEPTLLPVVRRVIQQLNLAYVDCAGVNGKKRLAETYSAWLLGGHTGPSGLRQYVQALGEQLYDTDARAQFSHQAEQLLLNLQSGFAR